MIFRQLFLKNKCQQENKLKQINSSNSLNDYVAYYKPTYYILSAFPYKLLMKFIKKTLLSSSKPSSNIQALRPSNQHNDNFTTDKIQEQLKGQYQRVKTSVKITRNRHKYQAYFQSFEGFLDVKDSMINKKIDTVMSSLHLGNKKKEKQIPLIEAFTSLSNAEKYKFLIDLMKYASEFQQKKEQQKPNQSLSTPTKKRLKQIEQIKANITSQASISLNELKPMSLSYWTKVQFELSLQKREIKVTGKQSFVVYLENYLVRLSRKERNCFVLLCCNRDQVPSWLRKVYINLKSDIFVQVFQSIWTEIIHIQVQKMTVSFEQVNNFVENSPIKSSKCLSVNQDQCQLNKQNYLVFLTPFTIRNYLTQKGKFIAKQVQNKSKLQIFKEIQYSNNNSTSQKLTKIEFLKGKDYYQRNNQIYQVKGYFKLPTSVVKFKFVDSLKERNRFITSWEILQTQAEANLQVISQTLDFIEQFMTDFTQHTDQNMFRFKQLFMKEESVNIEDDHNQEILTLHSIGQVSKNSFISFLIADCELIKAQRCCLSITAEFSKGFLRRKLSKHARQNLPKEQLISISNRLIEHFLKEMILMLFNQQKKYEQTMLNQDQQFFTICEAFTDQLQELESCSGKSNQYFEYNENENNGSTIRNDKELNYCKSESLISFKKVNRLDENDVDIDANQIDSNNDYQLGMRKSISLKETNSISAQSTFYLLSTFYLQPTLKSQHPHLVKQGLLDEDWKRLQQGGLTCKNEQKIKQQKQIIKKILMKLGENLLKQKNIMHVSLPVTIFKPESQLVTVARGLTYAPLLLEPQCYVNSHKSNNEIERLKKTVVFLISNNYAQINFEKPFNPILGETYQGWIDGCPIYFQQISHHPPVTYYSMLGRGYKLYGAIEPVLSLGLNNAKVTSWTVDCIQFEDGTKINAGPNKMMVNGTTFGLRTFNLDEKNFIYDLKANILALFSYGPTKKGIFSTSSQPLDFVSGKIMKMTSNFQANQYQKWRKSINYSLKKQWIETQIGSFQGIWNQKLFFDGIQYFDFNKNLPFQLVQEKHPLPSDCRYRQDLQWLIKKDLEKSQFYKEKMQQDQRRDKKLRSTKNK